jgi:hypothetical protein
MADYHVAEGLDLAVWHLLHNQGHGSVRVPEALAVIEQYGGHAKRVIPELEAGYAYWLARDGKKLGDESPATLIRNAIDRIKALPDKPEFELMAIGELIKNIKDPYAR